MTPLRFVKFFLGFKRHLRLILLAMILARRAVITNGEQRTSRPPVCLPHTFEYQQPELCVSAN
jgi:hypothetical protein